MNELTALAHRVLPAGHFGNLASDLAITRASGGHAWDSEGR